MTLSERPEKSTASPKPSESSPPRLNPVDLGRWERLWAALAEAEEQVRIVRVQIQAYAQIVGPEYAAEHGADAGIDISPEGYITRLSSDPPRLE